MKILLALIVCILLSFFLGFFIGAYGGKEDTRTDSERLAEMSEQMKADLYKEQQKNCADSETATICPDLSDEEVYETYEVPDQEIYEERDGEIILVE